MDSSPKEWRPGFIRRISAKAQRREPWRVPTQQDVSAAQLGLYGVNAFSFPIEYKGNQIHATIERVDRILVPSGISDDIHLGGVRMQVAANNRKYDILFTPTKWKTYKTLDEYLADDPKGTKTKVIFSEDRLAQLTIKEIESVEVGRFYREKFK